MIFVGQKMLPQDASEENLHCQENINQFLIMSGPISTADFFKCNICINFCRLLFFSCLYLLLFIFDYFNYIFCFAFSVYVFCFLHIFV